MKLFPIRKEVKAHAKYIFVGLSPGNNEHSGLKAWAIEVKALRPVRSSQDRDCTTEVIFKAESGYMFENPKVHGSKIIPKRMKLGFHETLDSAIGSGALIMALKGDSKLFPLWECPLVGRDYPYRKVHAQTFCLGVGALPF